MNGEAVDILPFAYEREKNMEDWIIVERHCPALGGNGRLGVLRLKKRDL